MILAHTEFSLVYVSSFTVFHVDSSTDYAENSKPRIWTGARDQKRIFHALCNVQIQGPSEASGVMHHPWRS
jgi:hypothetical protein